MNKLSSSFPTKRSEVARIEEQLEYHQQQVTLYKQRLKRYKKYSNLDVVKEFPYELSFYRSIVQNCHRKSTRLSQNYVSVSSTWRGNFLQFLVDMGSAPSNNSTIVRLNPKGDFSPDNCIWK